MQTDSLRNNSPDKTGMSRQEIAGEAVNGIEGFLEEVRSPADSEFQALRDEVLEVDLTEDRRLAIGAVTSNMMRNPENAADRFTTESNIRVLEQQLAMHRLAMKMRRSEDPVYDTVLDGLYNFRNQFNRDHPSLEQPPIFHKAMKHVLKEKRKTFGRGSSN